MRALVLALGLFASPVGAQLVSSLNTGDTTALATKAELAAVQAQMPQPATSVPLPEQVTPTVGTSMRYRRMDDVQPRITRAGTATTDASGNWTITWTTPLTAVPVVLPVPVDGGSQPVMCAVSTRTTTGATGKCFRSQLLPSTLTLISALVNFNVLGGAASGVVVQILAIPPTQ